MQKFSSIFLCKTPYQLNFLTFMFCLLGSGQGFAAKYIPPAEYDIKRAVIIKNYHMHPKEMFVSGLRMSAIKQGLSEASVNNIAKQASEYWDEQKKIVETGKVSWFNDASTSDGKTLIGALTNLAKSYVGKGPIGELGKVAIDYAKELGIYAGSEKPVAEAISNAGRFVTENEAKAVTWVERATDYQLQWYDEAKKSNDAGKIKQMEQSFILGAKVDFHDTDEQTCLKGDGCDALKLKELKGNKAGLMAANAERFRIIQEDVNVIYEGLSAQNTELRNELNKTAKTLNDGISKNRALLTEIKTQMDEREEKEKKMQAAEQKRQLDALKSADNRAYLQTASLLLSRIDPKAGQQFSVLSNAYIQIQDATHKFAELGNLRGENGLESLGVGMLTLNYVQVGLALFDAFSGSSNGPPPEQLILDQIVALQKQVEGLRTEMLDRFDFVDNRLNNIYFALSAGLEDIKAGQYANLQSSAKITQLTLNTQSLIIEESNRLADALKTFALDNCIQYYYVGDSSIPKPDNEFKDCAINVNSYVNKLAANEQLDLSINSTGSELLNNVTSDASFMRMTDAIYQLFTKRTGFPYSSTTMLDPTQWRQNASAYTSFLNGKPSQTYRLLTGDFLPTSLNALRAQGDRIASFRQNALRSYQSRSIAPYEVFRNETWQGGYGEWTYDNGDDDGVNMKVGMDQEAQQALLSRMPHPLKVAAERGLSVFNIIVRADDQLSTISSRACTVKVQFTPPPPVSWEGGPPQYTSFGVAPFAVASVQIDYPFCLHESGIGPGSIRREHIDYARLEFELGWDDAWVAKGQELASKLQELIRNETDRFFATYFAALNLPLRSLNLAQPLASMQWVGGYGNKSNWGATEYWVIVKSLIEKQYYDSFYRSWKYKIPNSIRVAVENGWGYYEFTVNYVESKYNRVCVSRDIFGRCFYAYKAEWDKHKAELFLVYPDSNANSTTRILLGSLDFYQTGDTVYGNQGPYWCGTPACLVTPLTNQLANFIWQDVSAIGTTVETNWSQHRLAVANNIVTEMRNKAITYDEEVRWENAYHLGLTRFAFGEVLEDSDFLKAIASGAVRLPLMGDFLRDGLPTPTLLGGDNTKVWLLPDEVQAETDALRGVLRIIGGNVNDAIVKEGLWTDGIALETLATQLSDERFISDCINIRAGYPDNDRDGIGDACDLDDDNDKLTDAWEIEQGLNPISSLDAKQDIDKDGLLNIEEYNGLTTLTLDANNNGIPDYWEFRTGLVSLSSNAKDDPDNDGLTNLEEYVSGRNPILNEAALILPILSNSKRQGANHSKIYNSFSKLFPAFVNQQ